MNRQYKKAEKREYLRMELGDFEKWTPQFTYLYLDVVLDVLEHELARDEKFYFISGCAEEQNQILNDSAVEANRIIKQLMKRAK